MPFNVGVKTKSKKHFQLLDLGRQNHLAVAMISLLWLGIVGQKKAKFSSLYFVTLCVILWEECFYFLNVDK